jgi:DNA recombination protein RmuC
MFGKRVNDIYSEETKQRTSLLTEIKNLKDLNNQISQDAINLTKALKGENKTQGDWGELILSKILEQTGLREGIEYTTQGSFTDNDGKRLRPDVIVHLPANKDIVIDSKVSLNAYLKFTESNNEVERELAAKELIKSIYTHIKGLSVKSYENIDAVKTLDFVLMFIPIEGAFMLAASKDNNLFKTAFENNIMLVSPSTLFATLRTVENIWRYEHQNENALIISKKAADLYDKFASFVNDIETIGININRTQKAYDDAMKKLSLGKGNLLRRSEEFIELGVKAKKKIDTTKLLDE